MIGQITKTLFGYDFFISYSHQDGKPYAESLERELAAIDCVAFRDESEHGQGSLLEVWLKFSIRRSSAIIVVGTEGALASYHVKREVENATAWKKQLLPVDAMGIRTRACWPGFTEERIWIEDPSARVPCPACPSPEVIGLLSAKLQHERKNRWTRTLLGATALIVAGLAGLAWWQWRAAVSQTKIATQQRNTAQANERRANSEKERADNKTYEAVKNLELAQTRERIARSRALAIRAAEERSHPETSLLLALAAIQTDRTFEAESALLGTFLLYPRLQSSFYAWHDAGRREVEAIAYSPDGKEMAVGYADGALIIRKPGQTEGVYLLKAGNLEAGVAAVVFSPDGRFLAAALPEGTIRIWDRKTNRQMPAIRTVSSTSVSSDVAPSARPEALAFDPRSGLLAAGQFDGRIRLWNIMNGQAVGAEFGDPIPETDYHRIGVLSLAFAADGSFLVSGHGGNATSQEGDATIRLWQAGDGYSSARTLASGLNTARALAIHPQKNLVAIGGSGDIVEIIDVKSERRTRLKRYLKPGATSAGQVMAIALAFNSTGEMLASAYDDNSVALWSHLENFELPLVDSFATGPGGAVAFQPRSETLATGGADGVVRLWRTSAAPIGEPLGATDPLYAVAFSPDGRLLATTGVAGTLQWWDTDRRAKIAKHELGIDNRGRRNEGTALSFAGDREVLLLIDSGALLRCTPTHCLDMSIRIERAPWGLWSASFGPGASFWFEWRDRPYRCSVLTGCEQQPGGTHQSYREAVNLDGSRWAFPGYEDGRGTLQLCERTGCKALDPGSAGFSSSIMGVQFDPSGTLLAAGTGDGRVVFFDGRTGARLGPPVQAHNGGVEFLAFSPDGKTMASGGRGGTVLLWNIDSRQPISAAFPRPGIMQVHALLFHPDGKRLLVQYSDGMSNELVLIDLDVRNYWESRACRAAGRNLTPAEWRDDTTAQDVVCKGAALPPRNWEPRPPLQ